MKILLLKCTQYFYWQRTIILKYILCYDWVEKVWLSLLCLCKYEYETKWDYVVTKVSSQDNCNAITSIKKHKQNRPMGSYKVM